MELIDAYVLLDLTIIVEHNEVFTSSQKILNIDNVIEAFLVLDSLMNFIYKTSNVSLVILFVIYRRIRLQILNGLVIICPFKL